MNRFKVNVAKEKFLRLQQKYSKNAKQEEEKSSSESLISVTSGSSDGEEKKNSSQQEISTVKKPVLRPKNTDDNPVNEAEEEALSEEENLKKEIFKADLELHDNSPGEHNFNVAEQKITQEKPPASPSSLVLSDLSNQFERIRFISSSSEDLSLVESESSQTKSMTTDTNKTSIEEISAKSEDILNKEKEPPNIKESETLISSYKKTTVKSLSNSSSDTDQNDSNKSNDSSKISSIEEFINYESVTDISHETQFLDSEKEHNDANVYDKVQFTGGSPKNNKSDGSSKNLPLAPFDLGREASLNVTPFKEREMSSDSDTQLSDTIYSPYVKDTKPKSKRGKNLSINKMEKSSQKTLLYPQIAADMLTKNGNFVHQSTNTDPVKVKSLKTRLENNQQKPVSNAKRPAKCKNCKHGRLGKAQDFQAHQSNKRPFIKPCHLINKDEIKIMESKSNVYQGFLELKYNLTDNSYDHPFLFTTAGISCDEVISMLLRNQIRLTRHFMESHQRMYLQVCHAAQLLNENYSPIDYHQQN